MRRRPWVVVDNETKDARGRLRVLGRFGSERAASEWIAAQDDQAKVLRGGFGLDGPREEVHDA